MNTECLRDCSSTELLIAQKRIKEMLKTRHGRKKHVENHVYLPSRSPSRGSGRSRCSRKSLNHNFDSTKSGTKRSQSLIDLRDGYSSVSTCVDSINKKYQETYQNYPRRFDQTHLNNKGEEHSDDEDAAEKSVSLTTSLSQVTYSKTQESETDTRSKQYQKLSSAAKRLHLMLEDIHMNNSPFSTQRSQSPSLFLGKQDIPRFCEKDSITKLSRIIEKLTKNLQKYVFDLSVTRRKDKNCLEESHNENVLLKQQLNNSITIQKNLEGELKELNKEKKLLEVENKNLAIKIAPLLNENNSKATTSYKSKASTITAGSRSIYQNNLDFDTGNNNCMSVENADYKKFRLSSSTRRSRSMYRCSRRSSKNAGMNTLYWCNNNNDDDNDEFDTFAISQSVSDSNLTVDSTTTEDGSKADEVFDKKFGRRRAKSRDELDSIASYVRWKSQDFNRLHGKLNKSFEELKQLKQTMNWMSQEKNEILADLEDLVDSYRELERERDNYESILKIILKEKNSSVSNICELLDGLLVHLNTSVENSPPSHKCQHKHDECSPSSSDPCQACHHHHHECSNSKNFLESALHVVQQQNISIREEIAKLKESLQNTSGQNTVLQANNESLMSKVSELQKQVESKETEAEQREKGHKEKFEDLDKLYKTILAAKDDLEIRLQEKEREIVALNLKNVTDASEKALKDQTEKILELKEANSKLEKEVVKFRTSNDKLNQFLKQLKADLREQKEKYGDQIKMTTSELQKSKDQCNWLQSQLDNFKVQLQDAHERIKLQEKDKSILAHKVLTAEEERKTLDRSIQEIRSVMEADKLYKHALSERNEILQSEVNRLRTEKLKEDFPEDTKRLDTTGSGNRNKEDVDGSVEHRNNLVKTAVKTIKSKPTQLEATSSCCREKSCCIARKPTLCKSCNRHNQCCGTKRPITTNAAANCTIAQRTAAAKRLSTALSISNNTNTRPNLKYQPRVKAAASSGRQDSTQRQPNPNHRAVACSHSIVDHQNLSSETHNKDNLRKYRMYHHNTTRRQYSLVPKATVSLHNNPRAICHRTR